MLLTRLGCALAEAYLGYLFSEEGQRLAARHYNRPRDPRIAPEFSRQFPAIKLFTVDELFDGWANAQKVHFADGGTFDQIYQPMAR